MKSLTVEEAKTEKGYCVFRYDADLDRLVLEDAELPPGMRAPDIRLSDDQLDELKNSSEKVGKFRVFAEPVKGVSASYAQLATESACFLESRRASRRGVSLPVADTIGKRGGDRLLLADREDQRACVYPPSGGRTEGLRGLLRGPRALGGGHQSHHRPRCCGAWRQASPPRVGRKSARWTGPTNSSDWRRGTCGGS